MKVLNFADLHQKDTQHYLPRNSEQYQFQLTVKQALMGLPLETIFAAYPLLKTWISEMQSLLPSLFTLPPEKLNIDALYSHAIHTKDRTVCIQVSTNSVYKKKKTVLIEWGIRRSQLTWHDRVKLWTASECLSIPPENITLIILAAHIDKPTDKLTIRWNSKQHKRTSKWLIDTLNKEEKDKENLQIIDPPPSNYQLPTIEEIKEMAI